MTRLIVAKANGDLIREIHLGDRRYLSIGRSPRCQIKLDARSISRRHGLLFSTDDAWHLIDTGSMSGIWSSERRRQHHILKPDSWVRIGPAYFWISPSNVSPRSRGLSIFHGPDHDSWTGPPEDQAHFSGSNPTEGDLVLSVLEPNATRFRQVVIPESQGMSTFGRGQNCEMILDDPTLSNLHGVLYRETTRWCIADCGSKSGIFAGVNRYLRKRLETGLVLRVGRSVLRIEYAINSCTNYSYVNFPCPESCAV